MEALHGALLPYYLEIKFVHLFMVAMWSFSTAVAYRNYIVPIFRAWQAAPDDPQRVAARCLGWTAEQWHTHRISYETAQARQWYSADEHAEAFA